MSLYIDLNVRPQSGKQGFKLDKAGRIICYLKSAPEKGMANSELIKVLAKALKVPQATLSLVAGQTSRKKRVHIAKEISQEQLYAALGLSLPSDEKQLSLL